MPMRGSSRRSRDAMSVSLRAFGWEAELVATLRHTTLPWYEQFAPTINLSAAPITVASLGARDRLSLLAQFAAHQALLQFAGVADADFDTREWAVVQKRGSDCRLLRVGARPPDPATAPPVLTLAQHFADAIGAPRLTVFDLSWARAEAVYIACFELLVGDAAADLRWMRRAACGEILSPGTAALRDVWRGRGTAHTYDDLRTIDALRAMSTMDDSARLVVLAGGTPLEAYSALQPWRERDFTPSSDAELAERIGGELRSRRTIITVPPGVLDAASERVIQMLAATGEATWIRPGATATLDATRHYVVAPRITAWRALEGRIACITDPRAWIDSFVDSDAFVSFLSNGDIPPTTDPLASLGEPKRSYVAALALLGDRIPCDLARQYLEQFLYREPIEDLTIAGVSSIESDSYKFASDTIRDEIAKSIPAASRASLCRVASGLTEGVRAALLSIEAGDIARGAAILEAVDWSAGEDILSVLHNLPRMALTAAPGLAAQYASALVDAGRYRDARELASLLPDNERDIVLARCERRTGDYGPALSRLERLPGGFERDLLRAELLLLLDRESEAKAATTTIAADTADERLRLGYLRAVIAGECGEAPDQSWTAEESKHRDYYAARFATYESTRSNDTSAALNHITRSLRHAQTITQRLDALLDQIFVLFSAGRWDDARRAALEALGAVDETQGDRAAGGFLLTHAYLCADDAQWSHAEQRIARLRHFYAGVKDARRLAEVDVLSAHLDFSRGRFESAKALASGLLELPATSQIREAAALIVDETNWIAGTESSLHSTGKVVNAELRDRHRLMRLRRRLSPEPIGSEFTHALAAWERDGGAPPPATTNGERLKLFRSALGAKRLDIAGEIAAALGCELPVSGPSIENEELRILRLAATAAYPFAAHTFDTGWRLATRNRLGHWRQTGSLPPLTAAELDAVAAQPNEDWASCSEREFLQVDGLGRWRAGSREALAAVFHARAENERLRRAMAQDDTTHTTSRTDASDGIIGDSLSLREVKARITRAAQRDVAVCIRGESGTGKELVARSIHRQSARRSKTFTPLNCAALPENLIESELFGHVRGAFTGADRDRAGVIESSDGGTLFLDEIGELPPSAQAKLLRFLQEGEFRRVGDTGNRTADVRIVSATNANLESAIEQGRFREDLFYRIAGIEIGLPPLRERAGDIPALAAHFLGRERERNRGGASLFSTDVESLLASYRWPGNIRELENAVRGAHAMAGESRQIELEHLPERLRRLPVARAMTGSFQDEVARFRRELIERSLAQVRGNQSRAAALLKLSRQALAYQIRELGILVDKSSHRRADV